jgi:ribosomal protein L37E
MVIAYDAVPNTATPVAPSRRAISSPTKIRETHCRRCDTRLIMGHYEPTCTSCGHADYTNTRDMAPRWQRTSIVSSATRFVIRYVGESVHLGKTLTNVRLVRLRNRAVYAVNCPFCQNAMEETHFRACGQKLESIGSDAQRATGCRSSPSEMVC